MRKCGVSRPRAGLMSTYFGRQTEAFLKFRAKDFEAEAVFGDGQRNVTVGIARTPAVQFQVTIGEHSVNIQ